MSQQPFQVELPREPQCAAMARRWVEEHLSVEVPPDTVGDLKLVVTELVDNAYIHGRGPIVLRLVSLSGRVRVEVIDHGQGAAIKIREDGRELGGWGLRLVDKLTAAWGAYEGTTHVWADIETSSG